MRDSAGQLPDGLHLVGLSVLVFELLPLGDVEVAADHVGLSAGRVAENDTARVDPPVAAVLMTEPEFQRVFRRATIEVCAQRRQHPVAVLRVKSTFPFFVSVRDLVRLVSDLSFPLWPELHRVCGQIPIPRSQTCRLQCELQALLATP